MKKQKQKPFRNFVAKHSHLKSGAGQHVDKAGVKSPRVRQKRAWRRDILTDLS